MLAVTALALTVVFSIGAKATDAAFRMGRHALAAADQQVDLESTREVLRAFTLPPADGREREFDGLRAQSDKLYGPAVLWRDTQCAPAGPVAGLTLALVSDEKSTQVTCSLTERINALSSVLCPSPERGCSTSPGIQPIGRHLGRLSSRRLSLRPKSRRRPAASCMCALSMARVASTCSNGWRRAHPDSVRIRCDRSCTALPTINCEASVGSRSQPCLP